MQPEVPNILLTMDADVRWGAYCPRCGNYPREVNTEERQTKAGVVGEPCDRCGALLEKIPGYAMYNMLLIREWLWETIEIDGPGWPLPMAATILGCHRSMIDKLVERGILGRHEMYCGGFHMSLISDRTLKAALQAKSKTGKWTAAPKAEVPTKPAAKKQKGKVKHGK